jgi:signal transduction histidine kinase
VSDAELGELMSMVAHDLRTPLAIVYGFAKTLERGGNLDERQLRFLQQIADAAGDMDRMIANVSTIGHAISGRWQPALSALGAAELAVAAHKAVAARTDGRVVGLRPPIIPAQITTELERAARALALLAEASLRLDPSRPEASIGAEKDCIAIGPFSPELIGIVTTPGRDVAVEAARMVLERLGARIGSVGDDVLVRLPT